MNDQDQKRLYQIALTLTCGVGDITARNLLTVIGSPEEIFTSSPKALASIRGLHTKVRDEILNKKSLARAEQELAFVQKHRLQMLFIDDASYPQRLRECSDAPVLLYYKGNADLNASKIISMVGTRNATNHGNAFCELFISELSKAIPEALIVSGLAYGIDIQAHRQALAKGMATVGVTAHGMDRIYPSAHRQTSTEMVQNGGLLTEFASETEPERFNFVRRNRIVAGMADAVVVVESDTKGGSLITAEIANSYCKDVFAVPGRGSDTKSAGCNKLIADHKADLLYSTSYFLQQMGWDNTKTKSKKTTTNQPDLFLSLTAEEQSIADTLRSKGVLHIDQLARETNIASFQLFPVLLELELKAIIKSLPGNRFDLM